jgi:hypothetical protein
MMRRTKTRAISGVLALAAFLAGDIAAPHSMTVPFFRDDGDAIGTTGPQTGGAGVITVTNTRNQPVTMYLVYTQNDVTGQANYQQQVPHVIGAKRTVQWRPVKTDPAEGDGQSVPDTLQGSGNFGSVTIYWIGGDEMNGALIGRYQEFSRGDTMMHVLLEDRSGS